MTKVDALGYLYEKLTGKKWEKEPETIANAIKKISEDCAIDGSGSSLPKLFLEGDLTGISKNNAVKLNVAYVSQGKKIADECTLKWQGTSSLSYPKKNFTIKLGNKVDLGFGKQKKYCLKANYIDHSHARNIVSARLWGEIVASRTNYEQLPAELKKSPNNGAVDGFPIKLYLNGKYEGIYTLNIPKDAWMFNMDDTLNEHCVLCGENYVSGCFRDTAKIDGSDWSDEVHDAVPTTILTRWNEVISFVMNSTDEEFKANIDSYIDLESLIDYYIFAYVSCGLDSMGKNQIYCTYDGGKWYASMYDMDSTWGLYWNGQKFVSTEYRCQEDYQSVADGYGNLLYERLAKLFEAEIVERYNELRSDVLSIKNIICKFEAFTDLIGSDLYTEDTEIYTGIPSATTNNIKQIRTYAKDRLLYVDKSLSFVKVPLTAISLSCDSEFYVNRAIGLTTTLEPANANTYTLTYESNATDIATVDESGVVTGVAEGTATITVTDSITGLSNSLEITIENVENGTLLYNWDFTQSLTDTVSNQEAFYVSQNEDGIDPIQDENGLSFTSQFIACVMQNALMKKSIIEVDVASMDLQVDPKEKNVRFLMNTSHSSDSGPLIWYVNEQKWGACNSGKWSCYDLSDANALSGKTVRLEIDENGLCTLLIDNISYGTTEVDVTKDSTTLVIGNTGKLYGGDMRNTIITGVRVYQGV